MSGGAKKTEEELNDEDLEAVSGGMALNPTFNESSSMVMDNIGGQTGAVEGTVGGLQAAHDILSGTPGLLDNLTASPPPKKGG